MELKDDFIIVHVIMPDTKPAYKIIFVDKRHLDDYEYFRELSNEERLLLRPYFMEIGGHWSEAHKNFIFMKEVYTETISKAIQKANDRQPLSKEQMERERMQAYFTPLI